MSENPTEDYKIPDLDVIDEDYTQALDKAVLQPQYNDINVMLSRNIHHQQSSQEKPSSQTSNEDFNLTTNLKLNLPGIRVESYDTNSSSKLNLSQLQIPDAPQPIFKSESTQRIQIDTTTSPLRLFTSTSSSNENPLVNDMDYITPVSKYPPFDFQNSAATSNIYKDRLQSPYYASVSSATSSFNLAVNDSNYFLTPDLRSPDTPFSSISVGCAYDDVNSKNNLTTNNSTTTTGGSNFARTGNKFCPLFFDNDENYMNIDTNDTDQYQLQRQINRNEFSNINTNASKTKTKIGSSNFLSPNIPSYSVLSSTNCSPSVGSLSDFNSDINDEDFDSESLLLDLNYFNMGDFPNELTSREDMTPPLMISNLNPSSLSSSQKYNKNNRNSGKDKDENINENENVHHNQDSNLWSDSTFKPSKHDKYIKRQQQKLKGLQSNLSNKKNNISLRSKSLSPFPSSYLEDSPVPLMTSISSTSISSMVESINSNRLNHHSPSSHTIIPSSNEAETSTSTTTHETGSITKKKRTRKRKEKQIKEYKCEICDKIFSRSYNLQSHMNTHTTVKPFKCNYCNKNFARLHDKKRHEFLHSGIKKFKCGGKLSDGKTEWGCGKKFARSDALSRHLKTFGGWLCIKPLMDDVGCDTPELALKKIDEILTRNDYLNDCNKHYCDQEHIDEQKDEHM